MAGMRTLGLAVFAGLIGCAGNSTLPENERIALQGELTAHARYLKVAMQVAPFFQDTGAWLLSDRALDEVDLIDDPAGNPVPPGASVGILLPGTRLRIDHIEFPTGFVIAQRVFYSPRYNPWVYLVPADSPSPAATLSNGKPFIIVLPQRLNTANDVLAELDRFLSRDDVAVVFHGLPPQFQEAIAQKSVIAGMGPGEVEMAWGYPERIHLDEAHQTQAWTWPGGKQQAFFYAKALTHWLDHGSAGGKAQPE
jgi:hypothetical protein